MNLDKICKKFGIEKIAHKVIEKGLINSTFLITDKNGQYILQEINNNVFKDIDKLMSNIEKVTNHIQQKIDSEEKSATEKTLNFLKTSTGKTYTKVVDESGNNHYYRMYHYIDDVSSYDEANEELLFQAGVGFGRFQRRLADFPAKQLFESIPDFHNTPIRFKNFTDKLSECDNSELLNKAYPEITFALHNKNYANIIMDALNNHQIPLRVVHNDTKLNNVMLDKDTNQPVCIIDLDTIMPGSLLFDYGDAIRYSANAGLEDDINLKNVKLDINKFKSFTNGFLKETANHLTKKEVELLPFAPIVIAYELGTRFLTDYLTGSKYFRCDSTRPDHNLERTRAQYKLMSDMIKQIPNMKRIVNNLYNENLNIPNK